jgi:FkbM family methyltransferase
MPFNSVLTMQHKIRRLENGYMVSYRNDCELEVIYDEIFTKNVYFFKTESSEPYIIDCGGHIGLGVLYFKTLYPQSRILTFEPNPETFILLNENIAQNNLSRVRAVNQALSGEDNKNAALYVGKSFIKAWDSTNTIMPDLWPDMDRYQRISVASTRLSPYINEKVDFIKLDIEGAEYDVLSEIKSSLSAVDAVTLEYHQTSHNLLAQKLETITEILRVTGFNYELFHEDMPVRLDSLPQESSYRLIIKAVR